MENLSFWCSGRLRAAQKPFKKVGGFAPYLLKGFLGRPGPPRAPKRQIFHQITKPPSAKPPSGNRRSRAPGAAQTPKMADLRVLNEFCIPGQSATTFVLQAGLFCDRTSGPLLCLSGELAAS